MIALLSVIGLLMAGVMLLAWIVQRGTGNGGWVDVFWSFGTGACCVGGVLLDGEGGAPWRRLALAALVGLWSLRLGLYIARRVAEGPEDVRYAALRREWGEAFDRRLLRFVLIQAPVSAILAASVLFAGRQPDQLFDLLDVIGLAIALLAILGEGVADRQMKRFRSDPANKGKVCDRGLWACSRHPNYFFEALFWVSYPVIALDLANPWSFSSWLAPLVMAAALRFGSGVPPLESAMLASKGEAYRHYQERVPAILPRWPRNPRI